MPETRASAPGLTDLEACQTRGDFGRFLTRLRGAAGLSIRDVSAATGIPVATLGDYFNGRHLPPVRDRMLERIVRACGVTDDTLVAAWSAARDRVRPTPGRPAANAPVPYRGLAFFRTEDAAWFFGRAELTARLDGQARRLREQGLPLVVTGPSGAGRAAAYSRSISSSRSASVTPGANTSSNWSTTMTSSVRLSSIQLRS